MASPDLCELYLNTEIFKNYHCNKCYCATILLNDDETKIFYSCSLYVLLCLCIDYKHEILEINLI